MIQSLLITRLSLILILLAALLATEAQAEAQALGPSVTEVNFSYTTVFQTPENNDQNSDVARAEFHAKHIFGIFKSPYIISKYIGPYAITDGLGAPRIQMKIKILSSETTNGVLSIKYSNSGKMILNKNAAEKILTRGTLVLPMPTNPYDIYNVNCTDEKLNSDRDFWYFYDPFRKGCEYLSKKPMATYVLFKITPTVDKKMELSPELPVLRGDNANGDLFTVYIIGGYYDNASDKKDLGYKKFRDIRDTFLQQGFIISSKQHTDSTEYQNVYTKTIELDNGQIMQVEVHHLLEDTTYRTRSNVFAKFFKEAVAEADVIVYSGHSGFGNNLNIPLLETEAGQLNFNPQKKQIFFFDSCASYSFYLEQFAIKKPEAKFDIISYGLSSYYGTSNAVLFAFLGHLFNTHSQDVPWMEILSDMENTLDGDTYLLNVGRF